MDIITIYGTQYAVTRAARRAIDSVTNAENHEAAQIALSGNANLRTINPDGTPGSNVSFPVDTIADNWDSVSSA